MPDYELDEWITVMERRIEPPSTDYLVVTFPNDELRETYLSTAAERAEEEVRAILRNFLIPSRSFFESDRLHLETLKARKEMAGESSGAGSIHFSEYDKRVLLRFSRRSQVPTWEGITWVLDLLPHFPRQALDAVHAYLLAHAQVLPDLRIDGLSDAVDLIRARYITQGKASVEALQQLLLSIDSRDFEYLTAHLYREMGYEVTVTPPQKDGGKDVIARKAGEVIYIECKNWRGKVPADVVNGLVGRVETDRVTKGIAVATSGFTEGPASATAVAERSPARITLVTGTELITQLNEAFGSRWHHRLDRLIQQERRSQDQYSPH